MTFAVSKIGLRPKISLILPQDGVVATNTVSQAILSFLEAPNVPAAASMYDDPTHV